MLLKTLDQLGLEVTSTPVSTPKGDHLKWHTEKNAGIYDEEFLKWFGSEVTIKSRTKNGFILKECPDLCWGYETIHSMNVSNEHESALAGREFQVQSVNSEQAIFLVTKLDDAGALSDFYDTVVPVEIRFCT